MQKLNNQSPLFDITNRINDLIEEFNNNKEIYENFKPNIKETLGKTYESGDLPAEYVARVMGLYEINLKTTKGMLEVELYRDGNSSKVILDSSKQQLQGFFLSKGDKVIFRGENMESTDEITIEMIGNILDTFIEQYEKVQTNIDIVEGMSSEVEKNLVIIEKMIKEFYKTINFEPVSQSELRILLNSIGD